MARSSHGTGTPGRMNEVLGRDALGFIARQTVQTQDFSEAIYAYPDGKQGHWVHLPHSETLFWVGDLTGGSTFEPGAVVFVASISGKRGKKIIGRSPAGMVSASVATVTAPPSVGPAVDPVPDGDLSYRGWAYSCDGSSSVLLASFLYKSGPMTVELRVATLAVSDITGDDINFLGDASDGGVSGTESFVSSPEDLSESAFASKDHRCLSVISDGTVTFVVHTADLASGSYVVSCFDATGALLGSDTFTGRTPPTSTMQRIVSLNQHSSVLSSGVFYFAHPIGSGDQEFRLCTRSDADASVVAYVDIDFAATDFSYAGMTPLPSGGVRVWLRYDVGFGAGFGSYMDFDSGLVCALGVQPALWPFVSPGEQYQYNLSGIDTTDVLGNVTMAGSTAHPTASYVLIGTHSTGPTLAAFDLDSSTVFVSAVSTDPEMDDKIQPIFPCSGDGFIISATGLGPSGQGILNRILSDGTKA